MIGPGKKPSMRKFLLAIAVFFALASPAPALRLEGTIVHVADGDTVTLRVGTRQEKVRLLGIDAPEKAQVPWGPRATAFLVKLVDGKAARVDTDVQERDRYGRLLGYLHSGGTFVNLELVRQGHAMLYTSPPNVAHSAEFVAAQKQARTAKRNLWQDGDGLKVEPYSFRHNGKRPPRGIGQDLGVTGQAPIAVVTGFIGNRHTHKYHSASCALAGRIFVANRVEFASVEAAESAGMVPCRVCHPRK